jgi:hypothetical protein
VLRQLARLTQPLPAAGPGALAVAVYGDAMDIPVDARESGIEGVACVDDAARLLDVICDVWARTKLPWIERWARGLLEFVLWMQAEDGRWLNFVFDWEGARNVEGITSGTGENFWHARALLGTSNAWLTFGDARAEAALHRGLDHAVAKGAPPDVRVLHMEVARRLIAGAGKTQLLPALREWAGEIASCNIDGVLMNSAYERGRPHLWAHIQEGVLAEAGRMLDDDALVEAARTSAERLLAPIVRTGFDQPSVSPYDVASVVFSLDRLAIATSDAAWAALAVEARSWFDGRNQASQPVYDPDKGRVADGVDEARISDNSGAEANVVAAYALLDRAVQVAQRMEPISILPGL